MKTRWELVVQRDVDVEQHSVVFSMFRVDLTAVRSITRRDRPELFPSHFDPVVGVVRGGAWLENGARWERFTRPDASMMVPVEVLDLVRTLHPAVTFGIVGTRLFGVTPDLVVVAIIGNQTRGA